MKNVKFLLLLAIIIYIAGYIVGCAIFSFSDIDLTSQHNTQVYDTLTFEKILLTNLKAILLLTLGFGVVTAVNLMFNGANLAFLYVESLRRGMYVSNFVYLILPHGIFEIPAIIIAGVAGFKIPYEVVRYLLGKKESVLTKEDIKEYLTLAIISIILIVIAAWIEANVTLKIAKAILKAKGI